MASSMGTYSLREASIALGKCQNFLADRRWKGQIPAYIKLEADYGKTGFKVSEHALQQLKEYYGDHAVLDVSDIKTGYVWRLDSLARGIRLV